LPRGIALVVIPVIPVVVLIEIAHVETSISKYTNPDNYQYTPFSDILQIKIPNGVQAK
jgi:hypothetical protein